MAALLTIESQSSDKIALYLAECRDLGVPVLPPDVNRSDWRFTVEPEGVRFGLGAVKGAGEGAIRSVLAARAEQAADSRRCSSLAEHVDLRLVNKKVLECLIKAGAFDTWRRAAARAISSGVRVSSPVSIGFSITAAVIRTIATRGSRTCLATTTGRRALDDDAGLPAGCRVDGDRSADIREGSARALHERPSAPALRRGHCDHRGAGGCRT